MLPHASTTPAFTNVSGSQSLSRRASPAFIAHKLQERLVRLVTPDNFITESCDPAERASVRNSVQIITGYVQAALAAIDNGDIRKNHISEDEVDKIFNVPMPGTARDWTERVEKAGFWLDQMIGKNWHGYVDAQPEFEQASYVYEAGYGHGV